MILPSRTLLRQTARVAGDLPQRLAVGVEDRRHDQGVLAGDGDPDVDTRVELELAVAIGAVRARELAQRERGRLDHEVVERRRDPVLADGPLELLAELDGLRHVDLGGDDELRRGRLGLGHPPRDRLLQPREVLDRRLAAAAGAVTCGAFSFGGAGFSAFSSSSFSLGAPSPAAASTSAFTIRPPGPEPSSAPSSTPSSRAIRRATGEALTRPLPPPSCSSFSVATADDSSSDSSASPRPRRRRRPPWTCRRRRRRCRLSASARLRLRRRSASASASSSSSSLRPWPRCRPRRRCRCSSSRRRRCRSGFGLVVFVVVAVGLGFGRRPRPRLAVGLVLAARPAALPDLRDRLPDGQRVPLLGDDLQDAGLVGLVRHVGLVGLDLDELLTLARPRPRRTSAT